MGPRGRRPGAAAEPRAVAVAAPVAPAAPSPAEPAGSSTGAREPAVLPAADAEAVGRLAGTLSKLWPLIYAGESTFQKCKII